MSGPPFSLPNSSFLYTIDFLGVELPIIGVQRHTMELFALAESLRYDAVGFLGNVFF